MDKKRSSSSPGRLALSDDEVIARVRAGEVDLFELLMRRYNQLVFRIARGAVRDDSKAEDLAQEAWVRAFQHLDQFAGRARFSTWISRIAMYEGLTRARRDLRSEPTASHESTERATSAHTSPEAATLRGEVRSLLEAAVDALPANYRIVFLLREIEELSTKETAEAVGTSEQTVKNRLHRARALLRRKLGERTGIDRAFPFLAKRCDRIVVGVLDRIGHVSAIR
ncbi:MAG: RNA polymerase sigma factor [Acidobacteriota bacterium]